MSTIERMSIGELTSGSGNGVAATGINVREFGDSRNHTTTLTIGLPAAATTAADLAFGVLLYTFPAGEVIINSTKLNVALTAADGNIDTDTPEVALGTDPASGVYATLGAVDIGLTLTTENLTTATTPTLANCTGTATLLTEATPIILTATAGRTVYLNFADTWAGVEAVGMPITGEVVINWTRL